MPCRDGGPDYVDYDRLSRDYGRLEAKLCETLTVLEDAGKLGRVSKTTRIWWRKHKKADAIRQAREKERLKLRKLAARARGKLTVEEMEALRHEGL